MARRLDSITVLEISLLMQYHAGSLCADIRIVDVIMHVFSILVRHTKYTVLAESCTLLTLDCNNYQCRADHRENLRDVHKLLSSESLNLGINFLALQQRARQPKA